MNGTLRPWVIMEVIAATVTNASKIAIILAIFNGFPTFDHTRSLILTWIILSKNLPTSHGNTKKVKKMNVYLCLAETEGLKTYMTIPPK